MQFSLPVWRPLSMLTLVHFLPCMQVVGQLQPGAGGVQRAPQPSVPLIPGLQALLAQQAATQPGALQGVDIPLPPRGGVLSISDGSGPHRKPANLAISCLQFLVQPGDRRK